MLTPAPAPCSADAIAVTGQGPELQASSAAAGPPPSQPRGRSPDPPSPGRGSPRRRSPTRERPASAWPLQRSAQLRRWSSADCCHLIGSGSLDRTSAVPSAEQAALDPGGAIRGPTTDSRTPGGDMTESATAIGGAERSEFVHRIWPAYPRHLAALRAEVRHWPCPGTPRTTCCWPLAAATGASTKELMARMGHSTMRAALFYQHATRERDRKIADGLSEQIKTARRSAAGRDDTEPDGHATGRGARAAPDLRDLTERFRWSDAGGDEGNRTPNPRLANVDQDPPPWLLCWSRQVPSVRG